MAHESSFEEKYLRTTSTSIEANQDDRFANFRDNIEKGFYFKRHIYSVIAEKIIDEFASNAISVVRR